MAINRLPSVNDARYGDTKADYSIDGLEELEPFAVYRYDSTYELYCVPSHARKEQPDRLFLYARKAGQPITFHDRSTGSNLCLGRFVERMSEEERRQFVKNYERFKEITGFKDSN